MTDKVFTGKWMGQFTYGEGYGERLKGKSGGFAIVMEVEGSGRLTGTCIDEGSSEEVEAVIEGSVISGNINFVKRYRHYWTIDDDGNWIENQGRGSHEVIYSGQYRNNVFTGDWKIVTAAVKEDGSIREWVSTGYWIMHRENGK